MFSIPLIIKRKVHTKGKLTEQFSFIMNKQKKNITE